VDEPGHQLCHDGLLAAGSAFDHPQLGIVCDTGQQGMLIQYIVLIVGALQQYSEQLESHGGCVLTAFVSVSLRAEVAVT
jgi:hypothetical protein